MQNKITMRTYFCIMFVFLTALALTGCSSTRSTSYYKNYATSTYRYPTKIKLPNDYPSIYLPDGNMWPDTAGKLQLTAQGNNNGIVQAQIAWYRNHQGFLNRSIQRGAPYIYYIYQRTKKLNLPAELTFIPLIEGGYNPAAHNSRSGASGMWQFLAGTGRENGLKIDRWYDGRHDVVASTNAALKYFTYLYYYFDKDWLAAIAAYDTGPRNVQVAIMRNQRMNKPTNFWALHLASETKSYIPQLLALSAIIKNPNRYGIYLTPINNGPYFEQVNVGHQIELAKAAKMAGLSADYLHMLNPAYSRGVTDPDGPYTLLIPKSKVDIFKKNLANGTYSSTTEEGKSNLEDLAKNINTKVKQTQAQELPPEELPQRALNEERETLATASKTTRTRTTLQRHQVTRGETLMSLARKYHTSASKLRKVNKLRSNTLKPKQTVLIPMRQNVADEGTEQQYEDIRNNNAMLGKAQDRKSPKHQISAAAETSGNTNENEESIITTTINAGYKIKKSENIFDIAKRYNVTAAEIRKVNKLKGNKLRVGQFIVIPTKIENPTKAVGSNRKQIEENIAPPAKGSSANRLTTKSPQKKFAATKKNQGRRLIKVNGANRAVAQNKSGKKPATTKNSGKKKSHHR